MHRALIVVDVQNDFCEGGSLAVRGGADVAAAITDLIGQTAGTSYRHVVATRDHHVDPGSHFAAPGESRTTSPPGPCTAWRARRASASTPTSRPPSPAGRSTPSSTRAPTTPRTAASRERDENGLTLARWLREREVAEVDVVGIATDHCVRATALDAAREGFRTHVLLDLTAGVAAATTERALEELRAAGVELTGKPVV